MWGFTFATFPIFDMDIDFDCYFCEKQKGVL